MVRNHGNAPSQRCDRGAFYLVWKVGGITRKLLVHDPPYPLPAGSRLLQDLGFLACTLPQVEILMPTKKPCGEELTREQQRTNLALHARRLRIEHVNSSVKRCRIVNA